jgi:hypothetical protein
MRLAALGLLAACNGSDKDVELGDDDDHSNHEVDCVGASPYVEGMSLPSTSGREVAISAATPTPPDVGDNVWRLQVSDDAGLVEGLTLTVIPWMPQHNHGLTPPDYLSTEVEPGVYEVGPFDLIMPGLWDFTVELGSPDDTAKFTFCAEG